MIVILLYTTATTNVVHAEHHNCKRSKWYVDVLFFLIYFYEFRIWMFVYAKIILYAVFFH